MAERIPQQLIQDIIAANDIVALIGQYVPLKRSGNSYVGLCPFHKEKTPSFHVSADRQLYYCFGCGAGGSIVDFVKSMEHLEFVEAIRFLADRAGIRIDNTAFSESDRKAMEKKQRICEMNVASARFFRDRLFSEEGKPAQEYIKKRRLNRETVSAYGLGYAPDTWDALCKHLAQAGYKRDEIVEAGLCTFTKNGKLIDRFRNRLMFPIIDVRGNVIAFGGRILDDGKVKYLNSPETPVFNKGQNLFSLQIAKKNRELILVEGYMDVISLYQSGITCAVASLGTALTSEQARLAMKYAEKITICYDTDGAGVKAAKRAIEIFSGLDVKLRVLSLPAGKDPDEFIKEYGAERFREALAGAETPAEFQISKLKKEYDIRIPAQKLEYVEACTKVIGNVKSSVEREMLRQRVEAETGIAGDSIKRELEIKDKKEKKAEKWNIRQNMPAPGIRVRNHTGDKIISLCLKDKDMMKKYAGSIEPLLTSQVQKRVFGLLKEQDDAAAILAMFEGDEVKEAAAALGMPVFYENNDAAMRDLIAALKKENAQNRVKEAIAEGDIAALNELLMKKGVDAEGGRL